MQKTKILWIGYNQNQTNIYERFLKMLQKYQIEVITTKDSLTGLEKALQESFDAIFIQETIYATPKPKTPLQKDKKDTKNTYNTIEQIKKQTSNTTILVLSDASKGEPEKYLKAGAKHIINALVIKPLDLLDKIPPREGYKNLYY